MFPNHFCFEITIITIVTIILYIPKEHEHVVAGKSTNNVVESSKSPIITGFFRAPKTSEYTLDTFLDTLRVNSKVLLEALKCIQ